MEAIETGLLAARIPCVRAGSGPRRAVILQGGNALLKRLDRTSDPQRYARQIAALLPPSFTFWILVYGVDSDEAPTLDGIAEAIARAVRSEIGKADVLLGVSFGGFVAQRIVARHPDLLDRLVLLVSAHRGSSGRLLTGTCTASPSRTRCCSGERLSTGFSA